jgi:hypothetical protein
MSEVLTVLITAASTLTVGLGTTWLTARGARRRDRDDRGDRERLAKRQAIIDLLDSAVRWVRTSRALFVDSTTHTPQTIGEGEALASYSDAEREFGKALTAARLLIRDADIRTKLAELSDMHAIVFALSLKVMVETSMRGEPGPGPAYYNAHDQMRKVDDILKEIESLATERFAWGSPASAMRLRAAYNYLRR